MRAAFQHEPLPALRTATPCPPHHLLPLPPMQPSQPRQVLAVAGWGKTPNATAFSPRQNDLLWVAMEYVPNRYCKSWFGQFNQSTLVTADNICTGALSTASACAGDSGGPLLIPGSTPSSPKMQACDVWLLPPSGAGAQPWRLPAWRCGLTCLPECPSPSPLPRLHPLPAGGHRVARPVRRGGREARAVRRRGADGRLCLCGSIQGVD